MLYTFESCMHRSNELPSLETGNICTVPVPVFLVGRFMPFKSAHWNFLIKEMSMDTKGYKCWEENKHE